MTEVSVIKLFNTVCSLQSDQSGIWATMPLIEEWKLPFSGWASYSKFTTE